MFKIIVNKDPKLCSAYRCKNHRTSKSRFCSKHHSRYAKERDLAAYTFNLRKQRAKERGHEWNITLEEFREFCKKTGYLEGKGKKEGSLSIDRIDTSKGYSIDNIRIMGYYDNVSHKYEECPF